VCGDKIMGYYKLLPKLKSWEIEEYKDRFNSNFGILLKLSFTVFLFNFLFIIIMFQFADVALNYNIDNPDVLIATLSTLIWLLNIGLAIYVLFACFMAIFIFLKEHKWIKEKEKKYKMCG